MDLVITISKRGIMNTGTVKFFNSNKGFGFITPEQGEELFFHISEITGKEPRDGDRVKFEVGKRKKGPCAIQVQVTQ